MRKIVFIFFIMVAPATIFAPDPPAGPNHNVPSWAKVLAGITGFLIGLFLKRDTIRDGIKVIFSEQDEEKYQISIVWVDENGIKIDKTTSVSEEKTSEKLPPHFDIPINSDSETYEK